MITVASLFAGIGGFCRAFEIAGARVVWANEKDPFAAKTYAKNHCDVRLYEKGIEELSVLHDELEPIDVLTAGFPCQPFSVAGNKGGLSDPRGRVFFEIVRLLKEFGTKRPKILLFENVPGLLLHEKGATYAKMVNAIQAAGYWFMPPKAHSILNTRKVTGIPQNRDRLYMVALSWDFFDSQCFQFPTDLDTPARPLKEFLDLDERAPDDHYFDPDGRWGKLFAESMESGDPENLYLLRRYYVRESKNRTAFTLTANMGSGGHNVPVYRDSWGIRRLTTTECLRLQGFDPTSFVFPADVSKSQRYKQIGNAVTVRLVEQLANECIRLLRTGARI